MYAVIETGGKQYRVEVGTELEVELLDAANGDAINLERVLLVADGDHAAIGQPLVANASVAAEIVRRDRGEKTISFKYRPKARRRVKKGHRQELTILRISDIVLDGKSAADEKAEADKVRKAERTALEATAKRQAAADTALAAKLASDKASAAKTAAKKDTAGKADAKPAAKKAAAAKPAPKTPAKPATKAAARPATKPATKAAAKPVPKAQAAKRSATPAKATTKPAKAAPKTTAKSTRTTKKDT